MKYLIFFIAILQFPSIWAQKTPAKEDTTKLKTERLKEVILTGHTMLGSKFEIKNKTGSASYISKEELKKFAYTDINRTLQTIPGVNIYEEDCAQI